MKQLVANGKRKKPAYMVQWPISQAIELMPTKPLEQSDLIEAVEDEKHQADQVIKKY